jgi:pimeloyl-ACP methyl ester carboxylesterase
MLPSSLCRVALAGCLALAATSAPAAAQTAFYETPPADLAGAPGSLIRTEPMSGAPDGAKAFRVLYRSVGLKGEPIPVSGVVIVPAGEPPAGGWPVVAWAHPTSGIVAKCAPSLAHFFFEQVQGLRLLLQRGYIVAATDYPGLGAGGPHPYLIGDSEGRAVLDSIRAARAIVGENGSAKAAAWGHSQGGQAVFYAGLLAKKYAPELDLVGVAAAAPATELGNLMRDDIASTGGKNLLAMTLWSWQQVYGAEMAKIVVPEAIPVVDKLADVCLESIIDMPARLEAGKELDKAFLSIQDPTTVDPWKTILAQNTIGTLPPALPVFIAQGTTDTTVDPQVTADYMQKLCVAGSRVAFDPVKGVGHLSIAKDSAVNVVAWIADRFAGAPVPTSCPR